MEASVTKTKIALLISVIALTGSSAAALTWDEVKSAALTSAPTLQSAKAQTESADAQVEQAKGAFLPKLKSSLSSTRTIDHDEGKTFSRHSVALELEQSIYTFGKDSAELEAAKANLSASEASQNGASVALRIKLAKAWSKSLYLQELIKITERNVSRREANYQIVQLRYAGGRENLGSVLKTESAKLRSKTDSLEAKANFELSKGDLAILIGKDIGPGEQLSGDLNANSPKITGLSGKKHPDLIASESKLHAAEESLKAARAKYLPDLTLSASARKSATPDFPLHEPIYAAGVTFSVPLFNPSTSAAVRTAASAQKSAAITLASLQATQLQKIKSTKSAFDFAKERLQVAAKSFEASKLQAEVSRQRYTLGLMSFQDWDSFESELIKSELDLLQAQRETAETLADYYEALGVTLEEEP